MKLSFKLKLYISQNAKRKGRMTLLESKKVEYIAALDLNIRARKESAQFLDCKIRNRLIR